MPRKNNKKKTPDPAQHIPGMAPAPGPAPGPAAPRPAAQLSNFGDNVSRRDDAGWLPGSARHPPRRQQQPGGVGGARATPSPQQQQQPGGAGGAQNTPPPREQQQTRPTAAETEAVARGIGTLSIDYSGSGLIPPKKRKDSKLGHFPGRDGKKCILRVNHFGIRIPEGIIYQYSVKILPPWTRPYKKADKDIYQLVINKWRDVNNVAKKAAKTWVFDGNSTLYCTQSYSNIPNCDISLLLEGDKEEKTFSVTDVKIDTQIKISQDLAEWAVRGQSGEFKQPLL